MQENQYSVSNSKCFNMDDYHIFLESKIECLYNRKNSLSKQEIIDYCSQFILTAKEFFPDKNQSTTSEKLRKAFGTFLKDKPVAVTINNYALYSFGYIYCNTCNTILSFDSFYRSKNTWNGYKHYCISCQKLLRDNDHSKKYIKNNRHKYNAYLAKYRASKLSATPPWLTKQQLAEIQLFYKQARDINMEVDHIVPLQGVNVCGLHVPWNLQLLTREQNASKSNNF